MERLVERLGGAAQRGDANTVRQLLARGVPADGRGGDSTRRVRPLMEACFWGHLQCVQALIDANAAVDKVDNRGWTALMVACGAGNDQCVSALVNAGAAVDTVNDEGWTALISACYWGHPECAHALVNAHADLELTNLESESALMVACKNPSLSRPQNESDAAKMRRELKLEEWRQRKAGCVVALLEGTQPIREDDFPDRVASFKFACDRLQLLDKVLATSHVKTYAPTRAKARALDLKTDAHGIITNFARDRLAA